MPGREWAHEMRAHIDALIDSHPDGYNRCDTDKLLQTLWLDDPELIREWLLSQGSRLLWETASEVSRKRRAHVRSVSARRIFSTALGKNEAGDTSAIPQWLNTYYTVGPGSRKPLRDLHAPDLMKIAEVHAVSAKAQRLQAAFLWAIAQQIGTGTVGDRYTDAELDRLYHTLHAA